MEPINAIYHLSVCSAFRFFSILAQAVYNVVSSSKETSLKILDLEVKEDNLSAINLYKKFNFRAIAGMQSDIFVWESDAVSVNHFYPSQFLDSSFPEA